MQSKKKRQLVEETILSSYESMYRIAFTYVKNQEDALDIVQDSACRAMQYADSQLCDGFPEPEKTGSFHG